MKMNNALQWLRIRWKLCLFGLAALVTSAIHVIGELRSDLMPVCVMFALALIMLFDCLNPAKEIHRERLLSWLLLAAAAIMSLCPGADEPLLHHLLLLLFFIAAACRLFGLPMAMCLLPPCAVLLLVVPFRASLMLYISYPLRKISTSFSAGILCFFDPRITWENTTITLPGARLAITDACSGIAQVEAMFLIAYLLVRCESCRWVWKAFHYFFLFPSIMLANTVRIVLTAALFGLAGEMIFSDPVHIALGYLQVLLTLGFFYFAGFILPEPERRNQR